MKRRVERAVEHIVGYLQNLGTADRHEGEPWMPGLAKVKRLLAQMTMLKAMEAEALTSPDAQVSLADPDARAMATPGRGSGMVGCKVQPAVEDEHHLIVVPRGGHDRLRPAAAHHIGRSG